MKNLKYLLFIVGAILMFLPFSVSALGITAPTYPEDMMPSLKCNGQYAFAWIKTTESEAYCIQINNPAPNPSCTYYPTDYYTSDPGLISIITNSAYGGECGYMYKQAAVFRYLQLNPTGVFKNGSNQNVATSDVTAGENTRGFQYWYPVDQLLYNANNATGSDVIDSKMDVKVIGHEGSEVCQGDYIWSKKIKLEGENVDWSSLTVSVEGHSNAKIVDTMQSGNTYSFRVQLPIDEAMGETSLILTIGVDSVLQGGKYRVYASNNCPDRQRILVAKPENGHKDVTTTISFNPDACTDYSLDVSCGNCDTTGDKPSFIIQDTTNWSGIINSSLSSNSNINGYFDQASGGSTGSGGGKCHVYCREEYRVYFPNEDDEVNVGAGRHFTFNLEGDIVIGTVPNYKEVKVDKIKECQATEEYEVTDPETGVTRTEQKSSPSCMSQYDASQSKPKAGETGDVTIQYTETYQDSVYNANNPIKLKQNDSRQEIPEETVSGASATYEVINWYELPDNTYRYIDMQTGESSFKMPNVSNNELINHYRDLGSSNLPLSYENYGINVGGENVGAYVGFAFALPGGSNMSEAFLDNNDYFKTSSTSNDNMYTKYVNNGCSDKGDTKLREELMGSTCAEMYGYGTSSFCECAKSKQSNKAGNCIANINSGLDSNYYQCEVLVCPEGEFTCSNGECSKDKLCPGDTPDGGGPGDPDGGDPGDGTGGYCEDCKGGICCPGLNMVCPDENGECPVPAGGEIIYRTIDLDNPFPGQADGRRDTGWNWCSYNVETNKISCNGMGNGNPMVHRNIINNRGYSSEKIYQSTPMYEFDLTPDNIKSIREYNREGNHKYSDWTLECDRDNGANKICHSTFLRNVVKIKSSSTCADVSRLGTCDDNGKER